MAVRIKPKPDVEWFRQLFEDRGLTQTKAAQLLDLHGSCLSRRLNGQSEFRLKEAQRVAKFFQLSAAEACEKLGVPF